MALMLMYALALVFVDFNERNVILEQPGLLQGELKTKTVQHLLQTGADVFVIYTGDNESENLPKGALYNTSLSSVHKTLITEASTEKTTGFVPYSQPSMRHRNWCCLRL
ncbi:uncharacterized protein LOC135482357 [Liolophura sinensis]|uniref:uncharacterized protein LOC135482357 n=1 Tax=Liolophura sinensis TaxID=3198878 RepID=UPI00315822D3